MSQAASLAPVSLVLVPYLLDFRFDSGSSQAINHHVPILAAWLRQREEERRPLAHLALGPHAAAVAVHNALHGGQADAGAGEFGLPVQPLKRAKEPVGVGHVEAGAVVADK